MALQVKELSNTAPTIDNSPQAQGDSFNIIPNANTPYDLYTAPAAKAAVIKTIRLVNISAASVKVNLYFMRLNISGQYRRRQITPAEMLLTARGLFIDGT